MRQIKFRAYHPQTKQWTDYVTTYGYGAWGAFFGVKEGYDESHGCVLMQFTGYQDKHGKDIYEGDIVLTDGGVPLPVQWGDFSDGCVNGETWMLGDETNFTLYGATSQDGNYVEIVGNIYENGDLLERQTP